MSSLNDYLFLKLGELNDIPFSDLKQEKSVYEIPDGALHVKRINNKEFDYRFQLNDNKIPFYHRSNGVTKTKIFNKDKGDHGGYGFVIMY